ncbi:hypothetical protein JG645_18550, partial [Vibrio cholerae]|uniref:hypothetical protein n=1 Tax=Vibrio cholerae TaxID=666 RepID=UPI0018F0EDF8
LAQNDPAALLVAARAMERSGDARRALDFYRRLYFAAPAAAESAEAATAILRLQGSLAAENADEARTRADRLFEAKLFKEATEAYGELVARFPRVL